MSVDFGFTATSVIQDGQFQNTDMDETRKSYIRLAMWSLQVHRTNNLTFSLGLLLQEITTDDQKIVFMSSFNIIETD